MAGKDPQLHGTVHVAPDPDRLYDDLAVALMGVAFEAVQDRGTLHLGLSGGSTPEPFYMRLVTDPRFRGLPWEQTHLWVVDERRVPEDDPRNNFRMIREALADHVPIKSRQKHPMPVGVNDPVSEYEAELREVFAGGRLAAAPQPIPRLDFVLLGMGPDAHTASLFPHSHAIGITDRWVAVNDGEHVSPPPRVTMTYPLLNAARYVAVLVTGRAKAAAVRRVEQQIRSSGPDPHALPITGIDPGSAAAAAGREGKLVWYLDSDAAG